MQEPIRPLLRATLAASVCAAILWTGSAAVSGGAPVPHEVALAADDGEPQDGASGGPATPDPTERAEPPAASPTPPEAPPTPTAEPTSPGEPAEAPDPTVPADPTATPGPSPAPGASPSPDLGTGADPSSGTGPSADPGAFSDPGPSADPGASSDPAPSPGPDPSASPPPSGPPPVPWTGRFNLYRSTAWVRQYTSYTCTAASAQTMVNLIRGRSDRSRITQQRIIRYARAHDYLRTSLGSDPAGWARAVTYFGGGAYTWRTFTSQASALRYAGLRMLATGKPVGLLVWRGRHAWTMTGFTATADPRVDPAAIVTGVFVAPPLVGVDPKPNAYLRTSALATFARYQERDGLKAWVNRWVVVAP